MTSKMRTEDRLDALERDIDLLRIDVVGLEREAGQLLDGEDAANAAHERMVAAQMLLRAKLDLHYDVTKEQRSNRCSIHGDAAYVSCGDCVRIHRLDRHRAVA